MGLCLHFVYIVNDGGVYSHHQHHCHSHDHSLWAFIVVFVLHHHSSFIASHYHQHYHPIIIIHYQSLLFTINHDFSFSIIIIHCHVLSFVIIHYHFFPFIIIHVHSSNLIIHSLSFIIINDHPFSFIKIHHHSYSSKFMIIHSHALSFNIHHHSSHRQYHHIGFMPTPWWYPPFPRHAPGALCFGGAVRGANTKGRAFLAFAQVARRLRSSWLPRNLVEVIYQVSTCCRIWFPRFPRKMCDVTSTETWGPWKTLLDANELITCVEKLIGSSHAPFWRSP